jgi:hypothetical protein
MKLGRKLTFQLTPLLDLLLIVIFAQYLDVQSTTRQETAVLQTNRDLLAAQLDEALRQILALRERMTELQLEAQRAELRSDEAERFQAQRDLVGEVVSEMFRIDPAEFDQALKNRSAAGPGPSPTDVAQLKAKLQTLTKGAPDRVVEHLLAFGEMRKRIDLWELYLTETGELILVIGEKRFTLRAETTAEIGRKLFEAYKTLPEPKSMVLILFTYGDAKFQPLKGTLDGLPAAIEQMRADSAGRSRFEYAVLGFRAHPPN